MAYSASAFQLTHLLQAVFGRLNAARRSIATGGSTTTVVDTALVDILADSNEDDYLNQWTVIITRDAGGSGAAPEGEFKIVSDYDDAGTITVPTVFSAAAASGDEYMYVSREFALYNTIAKANEGLRSLGWVPAVDTSITTAANQTEYTLPLTVKGNDLLNVELQGITTDANDNRWVAVPEWRVVPSAGGSTGTLILPQYAAGYTVRLTYIGLHPKVYAYDDYINEYIHPELATAAALAYVIEAYNAQTQGKDEFWLRQGDRAWNQLDIVKAQHPVVLPQRRLPNFPSFGASVAEELNTWPALPFS